jgi:hypothetical protein
MAKRRPDPLTAMDPSQRSRLAAGRALTSSIRASICRRPAYEALWQVAFDERLKIHDLFMEGVELALKKRGYPALADMKAKWQRKER